jgi:hypothetical protein
VRSISVIKQLENEGCVLTIDSGISGYENQLKVYWNGDTPERSREVAENEEIFLYLTSNNKKRISNCSISLSKKEAFVIIETLQYMINKLDELK